MVDAPNWWDDGHTPLHRHHPNAPTDHLRIASDRLALAALSHQAARGEADVTEQLGHWCLDLKPNQPDLSTVMAVLHGLDQLPREHCEPQSWHHVQAAEQALAAYLAKARGG